MQRSEVFESRFSTNFARLLIVACCAVFAVVLSIYQFTDRETPTAPRRQTVHPTAPQADQLSAQAETPQAQTWDASAQKSATSTGESAQFPAISKFRQWAETAAALGFAQADENKGMELAKARAIAMKALIQKDPASALRQALRADLRASLPSPIAAAIEQPVQKTGMVSIQMMCSHSPDSPHGTCEATPVLLEDVDSWNAYYGAQQWRSYVGQTVEFEGVAVDGELAVRSITPLSATMKR